MPGPDARTLVLLRHGKSGYPAGVADHDRPLAARGRREAALAGAWIAEHVPPLDAVLCSTSLRTRQTLERTGLDAPTRFLPEIYEAHPAVLREVVAGVDPAVRCVLLVGHGPGVPGLALSLAGAGSDRDAVDALAAHFPTSAIAVLTVTGPWSSLSDQTDLADPRARDTTALTAFHIPRD